MEIEKYNEISKNIENILDQFMQEEMGNRLSQFALLSLKSLIMQQVKLIFQEEEQMKG